MKPVILIVIAFVLLIPVNVFATHEDDKDYSDDPDYEGKIPLRFYQIFVSKDWNQNTCEEAKNSMLHSKSEQILRMYDYLPITSRQECVKVTGEVEYKKNTYDETTFGLSLKETMEKAKNWHYDLLIIFFDNELSKQYFEQTREYKDSQLIVNYGHIQYDSKTIVSATHVTAEDDKKSIQTLAHEIAHYVVQKNYGNYIGGEAVHKVEDEFRDCHKWQTDWSLLETCPDLWTTVKTHSMDLIPVMSPDYILEVAESMKSKPIPKPTLTPIPKPDPIPKPTSTPIPKPPISRCPEGYFEIDFTCRKDTSTIITEKMTVEEYEKSQQEREQRESNEQLTKQQEISGVSNFVDKIIGEIMWLEDEYPSRSVGSVRIIDQDMDLHTKVKDSFIVDVWSDSDAQGIELTVTETHKSSGVFEGTVFFTTTELSSNLKLRVSEGDTITAKYKDNTLPVPYKISDDLEVIDDAIIIEAICPENTTMGIDEKCIPICNEGTTLIDNLCQVEQIEEEPKFCFLFWCW